MFLPIIIEVEKELNFVCTGDREEKSDFLAMEEPYFVSAKRGDGMKDLRGDIYSTYVKKVMKQ